MATRDPAVLQLPDARHATGDARQVTGDGVAAGALRGEVAFAVLRIAHQQVELDLCTRRRGTLGLCHCSDAVYVFGNGIDVGARQWQGRHHLATHRVAAVEHHGRASPGQPGRYGEADAARGVGAVRDAVAVAVDIAYGGAFYCLWRFRKR